MQFRDFEPSGGNKLDLQQMIQQLGTGIVQNMLQRRQRQETAAGLQAMLPKTTPEQADMMAGIDPLLLREFLKQGVLRNQNLPMTENQKKQLEFKEKNLEFKKQRSTAKKKLTVKGVDAFLKMAGNDPVKAQKMAEAAGYEV